ncbi:MAG: galactose mutarotase [Treponema sp.]|jgi:aldose 1-epimerase|nr:galactose mutarotase [Treponema sp.]
MKIKRTRFGVLSTGEKVHLYTIKNADMSFSVTNFGCTITSIIVPSKNGVKEDIVLGYSDLTGYINSHGGPYYGAFIGRFANRIGGSTFKLNGETYTLDSNDGKNMLHGGFMGYDKMLFEAKKIKTDDSVGVRFTRKSKSGEQGFPGNLLIEVTYSLNKKNEILLEYKAWTDKDTPVNFTNHTYFNLTGNFHNKIFDHELMLNADSYLAVTDDLIPTGQFTSVDKDKAFDFRKAKAIGKDFAKVKGGYDHNFVINHIAKKELSVCAAVYEPTSGRSMLVSTNQPGVQFYAGGSLVGSAGKFGQIHQANEGFCLETQQFPDAPNHENFPSCILRPGEEFYAQTIYGFRW